MGVLTSLLIMKVRNYEFLNKLFKNYEFLKKLVKFEVEQKIAASKFPIVYYALDQPIGM